jgi:hypothetical protein
MCPIPVRSAAKLLTLRDTLWQGGCATVEAARGYLLSLITDQPAIFLGEGHSPWVGFSGAADRGEALCAWRKPSFSGYFHTRELLTPSSLAALGEHCEAVGVLRVAGAYAGRLSLHARRETRQASGRGRATGVSFAACRLRGAHFW